MELNELSYSDYVQLCGLVDVTPMASDAWHNYVNEPEKLKDCDPDDHNSKIDHISEVAKGLKFAMPPHFPSQRGISNVSNTVRSIRGETSAIGRAVKIGDAIRDLHRVYSQFRNTRITGGDGLDTPNNSNYNRMFGFSNSHKPIELTYEPPIENNLYTYNTQTAEKQELILSINQWKWQLPDGNLLTQGTLTDVFFPNFRQFAQASVNFNVQADVLFTDLNIALWFNTVMNAHAVYYFYANIIYYCSSYPAGNRGMFALRDLISTEDVLRLDDLRVRLRQIPIMKSMREAAFKFATPHFAGDDSGSTVCLNMPSTFSGIPNVSSGQNTRTLVGSTSVSESIADIFTTLNDLDFTKFTDMLARVYPDSVGHEVGPFNGTIVYDPEFLNHFRNFGSFAATRPSSSTYTWNHPEILGSNDATEFPLGSYTGGFNGAIEAMIPIHNAGQPGLYTSFCEPLFSAYNVASNGCYDSKWDFAYAALSEASSDYRGAFIPTNSVIGEANQPTNHWSPSITREETYQVYGGEAQMTVSSNATPMLGFNAYSQRQCYTAYFQYLLGINKSVQRGGGTSSIRGNFSKGRSSKRFKSKTKSTKESEE